jgi:hypothetical protein
VAAALVVLATALGLFAVLAGTAQPSRAADTALTCFGRQATITGSGTIIGTPGADVIVGSASAEPIGGLGGNDRICGLGGDDFMSGGLGNDRVNAGPGTDRAGGDFGTVDTIAGTNPDFTVDGGNDLLILGPGDDGSTGDHFRVAAGRVSGDGGNDTIDSGQAADFIVGAAAPTKWSAVRTGTTRSLGATGTISAWSATTMGSCSRP